MTKLSLEFFPPKTPKGEENLLKAVGELEALEPEFASVTYGAGGSTQDRTLTTLAAIKSHTDVPVAGHLTCVSATRDEVDAVAQRYWRDGVRHIVALRGDPPEGIGQRFQAHKNGYINAADLVAGLKDLRDFEISVSAYPEKHPESANYDIDMDMLWAKADAGATRAITQFFFETHHFEGLLERIAKRGIEIELVPGILPIANWRAAHKMAEQTATTFPEHLSERFARCEEDAGQLFDVAVDFAAQQIDELKGLGVGAFHLYSLNRSALSLAVAKKCGLLPKSRAA